MFTITFDNRPLGTFDSRERAVRFFVTLLGMSNPDDLLRWGFKQTA